MSKKRISKHALLNLILGSVLVVVAIFGYFYIKKLSPVEVMTAAVPFQSLPEYEFAFPIYGGDTAFSNPYEVLAFNDEVYVSDRKNNRIAVYDRTGKFTRQIVSEEIYSPAGMCWDGTNLWVAVPEAKQVVMMNPDGVIIDTFKMEKNTLPSDVAVDAGFMYVLNNIGMNVLKYDLNTKEMVKSFGGSGVEEGKMYYPYGIAVREGNVYVADSLNNRINIYDLEGNFIKNWPKLEEGAKGGLYVPHGIAFDDDGRLYTVEGMAHQVTAINDQGEIDLRVTKSETIEDQAQDISLPTDVTFDEVGRMYVLEHAFKRVLVYKRK